MRFLNYLNNTYRPRKILCVSKLTSLEYLRSQNSDLNVDQILSKMKGEGQNPDDILAEHQRQIACEQNLISVLNKLDISFRITKRLGIASRFMNWADLVVTIGGDGMFLLASKLITNNTKPVCGINPNISKKNTFTLPSKYVTDIESIFEKLYRGDYDTLMRSRIKTIMVGEGLFRRPFHIHEKSREFGEKRHKVLTRSIQRKIEDSLQPRERTLPWLALNEVFIGEFLAARPITLLLDIEEQKSYKIRCSGMCICTGTGSRFWYKAINIQSPETVEKIVEIATGQKLSRREIYKILNKYHRALIYSEEDLNMTYMIREMYHNSRCERNNCPSKQKCNKLSVKSSGFDAGIMIDGSISMPFNDGVVATFEIKPEYSLKTIILT
ncbi:NAD kinase 2, mitochondrial-like [Apis cerana]|uniref:NAD kinase 2, mitochondrial-like n=1 Tax=Apis cerana TaxID=7461 RepID=UPI002B225B42|nr:NAD kinase 2, mitochondrial-like [Apis cerana]